MTLKRKRPRQIHIDVPFSRIDILSEYQQSIIIPSGYNQIYVPNIYLSRVALTFQSTPQIILDSSYSKSLLIDSLHRDPIYSSFGMLPVIAVTQSFSPEIHATIYPVIHIDWPFAQPIDFDIQFELTGKELIYMTDLVGDKREIRMQKIARLYFAMKVTVRDIAQQLKLGKTQVYNDLSDYKRQIMKDIKKDLRMNKKLLGHMIELMEEIHHQTRTIWYKYQQLEEEAGVIRAGLHQAARDRRENPEARVENIAIHIEASKAVLAIHDRQQVYLALARQQTKEMLNVWDKFGLCGEEAIKLIMTGGIDVDVQVNEVRTTILKLVGIIKEEVRYSDKRPMIFGRMVKEIKLDKFQSEAS